MEKQELRDILFKQMLDNNKGISVKELVNRVKSIVDIWQNLYYLLIENTDYFDNYSDIDEIKVIDDYLIIKCGLFEYLIIDLINKKTITEQIFDKKFYEINFNDESWIKIDNYELIDYQGNINELIDYILNNSFVLINMDKRLFYRVKYHDAKLSFSLNYQDGSMQLSFSAPNQYLYEQLFINADLSPSKMQDAINKIGKEKMYYYFNNVPDIIIPSNLIPDLLVNHKIKSLKK